MSQLKVNTIRHTGGSADNITLDNSQNVTVEGNLTVDGTLTAAQRSNRNLIINGAMQVAQRGTSSTGLGASAGYFTLDRYRTTFSSTAGRATMSQVADVHDGFANALKLECTTADTSIAAGEYFILQHKFEGQDLQQLKKGSSDAEAFTVSFYVKGNASATYVVEMFDLDNSRQISKTFSVTTNWTRVALTFPADTTGALDDDNAASLQLGIWLHAGSNYTSGTLNSSAFAANTTANRAVGISSFFDSTNRTFFLTGLQMEVGSVATDFEHRSYADELARCQRYHYRAPGYNSHAMFSRSSTAIGASVNTPVPMRASPTAGPNHWCRVMKSSVTDDYGDSSTGSFTVGGSAPSVTATGSMVFIQYGSMSNVSNTANTGYGYLTYDCQFEAEL